MDTVIQNDSEYVYDRDLIREICPMFDEVLTFFDGKAEGQRMVRRADFTPLELKKYLPNMVMLELKLDAQGGVNDAYCRVCGSVCTLLYGEATGMWLSAMEPYELFERVQKRSDIVIKNKRELGVCTHVIHNDNESILVRVLYIPLSEDNDTIEKFLIFVDIDKAADAIEIAY